MGGTSEVRGCEGGSGESEGKKEEDVFGEHDEAGKGIGGCVRKGMSDCEDEDAL